MSFLGIMNGTEWRQISPRTGGALSSAISQAKLIEIHGWWRLWAEREEPGRPLFRNLLRSARQRETGEEEGEKEAPTS